MDFAFGAEHDLLRSTTRRFLEKRHPLAHLRPLLEEPDVFDRDVWREGADLGWTAMLVPLEHDGGSVTDQPVVDLVVLAEELGRVLYPGPFVPTNVVADALARFGSDALREELLPPIARGETVAAWCLSGDGTPDRDAVQVRATREGDEYRLDGVARHVHGAPVADLLLVTAIAEGGPINLVVRLPAVGTTVRTLAGLDLTRRFGEVTFDGVMVPASSALDGDVVARALDLATVLQCAEGLGGSDCLFAATLQYAKDRVQFGRPIGSFQAIKHRFADLFISLESMRVAVYYAALALNEGYDDAQEAVSVAGSYVGESYAALCGEALQLHGGIGFTWEHDVHLYLRRAKVDQVLYGDPASHRERLCSLAEVDA